MQHGVDPSGRSATAPPPRMDVGDDAAGLGLGLEFRGQAHKQSDAGVPSSRSVRRVTVEFFRGTLWEQGGPMDQCASDLISGSWIAWSTCIATTPCGIGLPT